MKKKMYKFVSPGKVVLVSNVENFLDKRNADPCAKKLS